MEAKDHMTTRVIIETDFFIFFSPLLARIDSILRYEHIVDNYGIILVQFNDVT